MLILWDCIYLPLPYAFQNAYDSLPVDFGSSFFWETRSVMIESFLNEFEKRLDNEIEGRTIHSFII